tara:strand:+ start:7572 stop:7898 length:327 start_codon:yes stop_codon:yes gene_type:complete
LTSAFLGDADEPDPDYNEQILNMIEQRMVIGKKRYGHGLRVNDDTRQWGTKEDSWTEMGLEEVLDLCVYLSAQILRIQERERNGESVIHSTPLKRLGFLERMRRWLNR